MPMAMTTLAPIQRLRLLRELERKVLWLSAWTIHHANHLRPNRDGLKVGDVVLPMILSLSIEIILKNSICRNLFIGVM